MKDLATSAQAVSLFCRLNIHTKNTLPIRASEMGLLIYLCTSEVPVTSVMAAGFFKVKKPMIANMVSALAGKGFLVKQPSNADKRSYILLATDKAKDLVDETFSEYLSTMKLLQVKLGGDFETLIDLLDKANLILLEERDNG